MVGSAFHILTILVVFARHDCGGKAFLVRRPDAKGAVGVDEILERAARVYQGLTADQIAHIEKLALDRRRFFRESAA